MSKGKGIGWFRDSRLGDIDDKYPNSSQKKNVDYGLNMPRGSPVDLTNFLRTDDSLCPEIQIFENPTETLIYSLFEESGEFSMEPLIIKTSIPIFSDGKDYVEHINKFCDLINYFIKNPESNLLTKGVTELLSQQIYVICFYIIRKPRPLKCREFYTSSQTFLRWALKFAIKFSFETFHGEDALSIIDSVFPSERYKDETFFHDYAAYSETEPYYEAGILENLAYFVLECGGFSKWLKYLSDNEGKESPFYGMALMGIIKIAIAYQWVLKDNMENPSYDDVMGAVVGKLKTFIKSSRHCPEENFFDPLVLGLKRVDITDERINKLLEFSKELLDEDKLHTKVNAVMILTKIISLIKPDDDEPKKQLSKWLWENNVYQTLFFGDLNDEILSKSEKLFFFMLKGNTIDHRKLVALATNSANPKITSMMSSALENGVLHTQDISLIGDALIGMFEEGESSTDLLVKVLKQSKPNLELKKKFINAAINRALEVKADQREMKSLAKDFERVLSIDGFFVKEDLLMFVSRMEHEKDPVIRTLMVVGIRVLFNTAQVIDYENGKGILSSLTNEYAQFCCEGITDDDYSLDQRIAAFTDILPKFPAGYVNYNQLMSTLFSKTDEAMALVTSNSTCFELFEKCFMTSNGMNESSGFRIKALPISNFDVLLRIALSTPSDAVFKRAASLLARALDAVSLESLDEMAAFRRGFVTDTLLVEAPGHRTNAMRLLCALLSDETKPLSCMDKMLSELAAMFPTLKPDSTVFIAALSACPDSIEDAAGVVGSLIDDEEFNEDDYREEGIVGMSGQSFNEILSTDLKIQRKVFDILFVPEVIAASKSVEDFYARSGIKELADSAAAVKSFVFPAFNESLESGKLFCGADDAIQDFLVAEVVVRAKLAEPSDVYEWMKDCVSRAINPLDKKGPSDAGTLFVSAVSRIVEASGEPIPGLRGLFEKFFILLLLKRVSNGDAQGEYVRNLVSSLPRMLEKIPAAEADGMNFAAKVHSIVINANPETVELLTSLVSLICRRSTQTYSGLISKLSKYVLCDNTAEVREAKEKVLLSSVFPVFFAIYDPKRTGENGGIFTSKLFGGYLSTEGSTTGVFAYFDNPIYARNCVRFLSLINAGAALGPEGIESLARLIETDRECIVYVVGLLGAAVEWSAPGSPVIKKCLDVWNSIYTDVSTSDEKDILEKEKIRGAKHGGLKNARSNCYANSGIQMLYMSELRSIILGLPIEDDVSEFKSEEAAKQFRLSKKTVVEAQRLFAEMLVSNKEYSDPSKLIKSFWEDDGGQDDIYNFMMALIDKVHTYEKVIKSLSDSCSSLSLSDIGESMYTQNETVVLCSSGHTSRKKDYMNVISLPIKGANTLDDAIRTKMRKEKIPGYNCLECGADSRVGATRTERPTRLGSTLIFRLDRVGFDYEKKEGKKNHRNVSFGLEIDMAKYVKGATEPDVFELCGVVMHIGNANSGHYYAYLRDAGEKDRWYKFNDESVCSWDVKNLEEDCRSRITSDNCNESMSAYILLYTRKGVVSNTSREEFIESVRSDDGSLYSTMKPLVEKILAENVKKDQFDLLLNPDFNMVAIKSCDKYFTGNDASPEKESMAGLILERTANLASEVSGFKINPWLTRLYPKLTVFRKFDGSFIDSCGQMLSSVDSSNFPCFLETAAKAITTYVRVEEVSKRESQLKSFFKALFAKYLDVDSTCASLPVVVKFVLDLLGVRNWKLDSILVSSLGLYYMMKNICKGNLSHALLHDLLQATRELLTRFQVGGDWGRNEESPLAKYSSINELSQKTARYLIPMSTYKALIERSPFNPEAVAAILRHVLCEASLGPSNDYVNKFLDIICRFASYSSREFIYSVRVMLKEMGAINNIDIKTAIAQVYFSSFLNNMKVFYLNDTTLSEPLRNEFIAIYEDMLEFHRETPFCFNNDNKTRSALNVIFNRITDCTDANPPGPLSDRLSKVFEGVLRIIDLNPKENPHFFVLRLC